MANTQEKRISVMLLYPDGSAETVEFDATTYTVVNGVLRLSKERMEVVAVQATRWMYAQVI